MNGLEGLFEIMGVHSQGDFPVFLGGVPLHLSDANVERVHCGRVRIRGDPSESNRAKEEQAEHRGAVIHRVGWLVLVGGVFWVCPFCRFCFSC